MATYTPQLGDVLYSGAQSATELQSRVQGFIAGCGWAALAVVLNAVKGTPTSADEVTAIIKLAIAQHQTVGLGGVATPANLMSVAHSQFGVDVQTTPWRQALAIYAGVKPVELGVSNARAFGGPDSRVFGHYITVVGKTAQGDYIVSDPNTPQSTQGQFVTYTPAQIAAATPFWAGVPSATITGGASGGVSGTPLAFGGMPGWLQTWLGASGLLGWVTNPMRIAKLGTGVALITIGLAIAFFGSPIGQQAASTVKTAAKTAAKTALIAS